MIGRVLPAWALVAGALAAASAPCGSAIASRATQIQHPATAATTPAAPPAAAAPVPVAGAPRSPAAPDPNTMAHGRFENVRIARPAGEVRAFVLLFDGEAPNDHRDVAVSAALVAGGAMVATIDTSQFLDVLERDGGDCEFADGDLENLSRHVQAYYKLPRYFPPILAGIGGGAAMAYAILAQDPDRSFTGALSIGFCPLLPLVKPLCRSGTLDDAAAPLSKKKEKPKFVGRLLRPSPGLVGPWEVVQHSADDACPRTTVQDFVSRVRSSGLFLLPRTSRDYTGVDAKQAIGAAFSRIASQIPAPPPPPPASLADLPITEIPAEGSSPRFAVLVSGDGGWAGIDTEVADVLVKRGISVAGIDSLRYFWTPRTPDAIAADLDRVIRHYSAEWKKPEVLLVGYSQGADVLPFAYNRLPAATRAKVRSLSLLALSKKAAFEFHLSNWVGDSGDLDIAPEADKLSAATTLCIYGEDEDDSLCPELAPAHATVVKLKGGHHFDGDYDALGQRILDFASNAAAPAKASR